MKRQTLINIGIIAAATAVSGALSGKFLIGKSVNGGADPGLGWGFQIGPGLFFGIAVAALVLWFTHRHRQRPPLLALLWLAASMLAWRAALQVVISTQANSNLGYLVPGALGSLILGVAYWLTLQPITLRRLLLACAAGAGLGYVMTWIIQLWSANNAPLMAAFAVWQIGVALILIDPTRDPTN